MRNTIKGARVYRFGETVAINLKDADREEFTETFYIPANMAEALGNLLLDGAEDCHVHPFTASRFGTVQVAEDGKVEKE